MRVLIIHIFIGLVNYTRTIKIKTQILCYFYIIVL
jgi:hypothetical protein